MWRFRLLLFPFTAVVELVLLVACWILAVISPARGERLMQWSTSILPDLRWYIGE